MTQRARQRSRSPHALLKAGFPRQSREMRFCACVGLSGPFPGLRESRDPPPKSPENPPPGTCSDEVVHQGVVVVSTQERARKYDAVEGDVVLGHEVVQLNLRSRGRGREQTPADPDPAAAPALYLLGVLPPPLPLVRVVGRDGQVADGSIEPHVEHLAGRGGSDT